MTRHLDRASRSLLWLLCGALVLPLTPGTRVRGDEIDDVVESFRAKHKIPGLAVLVVQHGQTVKAQGYGLATVEHQVPVTPDTVFQSGSMGKQFTATGVMMLVDEGKLGLDDSLRDHFPKAPEAWQKITVRNLLSHTAGLGDYPEGFNFRKDYSEDELLAIIYETKLKFEPGKDWSYSNLGYMVLGALIHKASGEFYGDYLRERIFEPCEMKSTRVINEADIVPHRAGGYRLVGDNLKNQEWVSPSLNTTADGSLYLTILDLARWDEALRGERLLKSATLEQMWTPAPLADGKPNRANYGYGWVCEVVNGRRAVQHGGAWQGFTTHIARYLDDELTVAVLTNLSAGSGSNPGKLGREVAGLYVTELKPVKRDVIEDPEPKITAKIRDQIERLARGEASPDDFSGEAKAAIFPDHVEDVKAQFSRLGTLQELRLVERTMKDGERSLVYRLRYERGPAMELVVKLTAEEKIAQIAAEAE